MQVIILHSVKIIMIDELIYKERYTCTSNSIVSKEDILCKKQPTVAQMQFGNLLLVVDIQLNLIKDPLIERRTHAIDLYISHSFSLMVNTFVPLKSDNLSSIDKLAPNMSFFQRFHCTVIIYDFFSNRHLNSGH